MKTYYNSLLNNKINRIVLPISSPIQLKGSYTDVVVDCEGAIVKLRDTLYKEMMQNPNQEFRVIAYLNNILHYLMDEYIGFPSPEQKPGEKGDRHAVDLSVKKILNETESSVYFAFIEAKAETGMEWYDLFKQAQNYALI